MKKITIVLGTAREKNFSQKISKIILDHLKSKDLDIQFIDVKNFLFGMTIAGSGEKEPVKSWADVISESEGIIFVCPEYNHSYPGELKILIDSLYDEYKGKVAGIVSVSAGQFAGVRVMDNLSSLLHIVNFKVATKGVNVADVQGEIDVEKIKKHTDGMLENMKSIFTS
ncbi:MAG: NAD(P)H-dependent FMN reductase [Crocinitomicaceae bacterium]|jgi:NAD(P)H-dependent FMN reductase